MKQHRYPGAQPFSTAQQDIFYGRDDDIARLHRLIKTETLVVLHAKSGMGKSSLLNAGIVPAVLQEEVYTPVHIRFNAWTEGKTDLPVDIARKVISPDGSHQTFLDLLIENERSLWHELKETQIRSNGQRKYLLIFDQFEELFTYPSEAIAEFRDQLAEAVYAKIPQRYRNVLEEQIEAGTCQLQDAEFDQLQEPVLIRILLSVRSDRLHLMDRLSDSLPDILGHCYELHNLGSGQAVAAIVEPARRNGDFISSPFTYSSSAVAHILDFLDDSERRIETIQLQILCRTFEERVQKEGISHFEKNTLGDLQDIIAGFYTRQIALLGNEDDQRRACFLIEEGLIVPEDRQRLTLHEAQIAGLFQVPREHLAKLVDGGLLRAEPALRGGYAYELSHDTLVEPALEARVQRRKREAEEAQYQQEAEVAKALAEERSKRQRSRNVALAFGLLALLSLAAAFLAFRQTQMATAAEKEAQKRKEEAEQQTRKATSQKQRADEGFRIAEENATHAISAQRAAQQLATKGSQLVNTISSSDTYSFLMREGQANMLQGNYYNALTHFATARFAQNTPEVAAAIAAAQTGLEAENRFFAGELEQAKSAYSSLQRNVFGNSWYVDQRLIQIDSARIVFQRETAGKPLQSIEQLSLSYQALSVLPKSLGDLSHLQVLDLSGNADLTRLPSATGRLKSLRVLIVKDCNLLELPETIGQLQALEQLDLLNNEKLGILPAGVGRLQRLLKLNLEACDFNTIPAEVGRLNNLLSLNLSATPLRRLPEALGNLERLEELKMNSMRKGVQFDWEQASAVIARMKGLKIVSFSRNALHQAPPQVLKNLAKLSSLVELELQFNGLKWLPPEIAALKNLKTLNLRNNAFDESMKAQIRSWLPDCNIIF